MVSTAGSTALLILRALEILPGVLAQGGATVLSWRSSIASIKAMVEEGRDPTLEEWETLNGELDGLQTALHTD